MYLAATGQEIQVTGHMKTHQIYVSPYIGKIANLVDVNELFVNYRP